MLNYQRVWAMFPLKSQFMTGVVQPATLDETRGYPHGTGGTDRGVRQTLRPVHLTSSNVHCIATATSKSSQIMRKGVYVSIYIYMYIYIYHIIYIYILSYREFCGLKSPWIPWYPTILSHYTPIICLDIPFQIPKSYPHCQKTGISISRIQSSNGWISHLVRKC